MNRGTAKRLVSGEFGGAGESEVGGMPYLVGLIICACIAFMVIAAIASATRPDLDAAAPRPERAPASGGSSDGASGAR